MNRVEEEEEEDKKRGEEKRRREKKEGYLCRLRLLAVAGAMEERCD